LLEGMTTDIATTVVRLSTPSDIVDAVPYLLGFQPEDSLVVLSLRGDRSRLGLTARVDLPPAKVANECAREFVQYLKRDHAARALVVFYPRSGGPLHPAVQPVAEAMTKRFARARIDLAEVLCVSEGRWWSLRCTDDECCPPEGTPVSHDGTSSCAAAMTVSGRAVFASREELARTLDPAAGLLRRVMAYSLERAELELAK
jgi:hypothetical protein